MMRLRQGSPGRISCWWSAGLLGLAILKLTVSAVVSEDDTATIPTKNSLLQSREQVAKETSSVSSVILCEFSPSARQARRRQLSAEVGKIDQRLRQRVSLHFDQRALTDALQEMAQLTGVEIVLDKEALKRESIRCDLPVSIEVNGIQARNALVLLLEPEDLSYRIEGGQVRVTTSVELEGPLYSTIYVVPELLTRLSLVTVNLDELSPQPTIKPTSIPADDRQQAMAGLVDLIVSTTAPQSWEQAGGNGTAKANLEENSIVVRQTRTVHEEIYDLLEQLVRLGDLRTNWHVEAFGVDPNELSVLQAMKPEDEVLFMQGPGWPDRSVLADGRLIQLDLEEADRWRAKLGAANCDAMLTLSNGQPARMFYRKLIGNQETTVEHIDLQSVISADRSYTRLAVTSIRNDRAPAHERLSQGTKDGQSLLLVPSLVVTQLQENTPAATKFADKVMAFLLTPKKIIPDQEEGLVEIGD